MAKNFPGKIIMVGSQGLYIIYGKELPWKNDYGWISRSVYTGQRASLEKVLWLDLMVSNYSNERKLWCAKLHPASQTCRYSTEVGFPASINFSLPTGYCVNMPYNTHRYSA